MQLKTSLLFLAATASLISVNAQEKWLQDDIPQSWTVTPQHIQTLPTDDAWWRNFEDPVLDSLINRAVANNYNVATAIKRIEMARLSVKETESGYFPTIGVNGGWTKSKTSGVSGSSSAFSLGASANWEIDVFGRVQAAAKAKKAAYQASRADYDAVMVSLCANVASTYMQLRMNQKLLGVANDHIASQERVVKITESRFEAELADMLDVTQAHTVLYSTQATIPTLKSTIASLQNSLAVLVGEYPGKINSMLALHDSLPMPRLAVEMGVPADLLRRRPDIMEAEMNLAQYAAQVGVAKKDFLPTVSIAGNIGTAAHKAGDLFGKNSLSYSIAPQISWTLFDGMARNYRTAEAKLQLESAVDSYNLTVMNAVEEVENAVLKYNSLIESVILQQKVVDESYHSLKLAVDLYKTGLTAFTNVVDGQMTWLESQSTLVQDEGAVLQALISIYQALGGGWEVAAPQE